MAEFKHAKNSKLSEEFTRTLCAQQKVWICKTCNNTLKRGNMPAANILILEDVPAELLDLNLMEIRLISVRIPFMKMVPLACGKQ